MGRFKKTDQIFAHLNITLQDSNLLLFCDRTFPIKKKRDRLIISLNSAYSLLMRVNGIKTNFRKFQVS
jgi:hypothetical protein